MHRRTILKVALGSLVGHDLPGSRSANGRHPGHRLPHAGPRPAVLALPVEGYRRRLRYRQTLDSHDGAQPQLRNAQGSVARDVASIVISPADSSTAPSILALGHDDFGLTPSKVTKVIDFNTIEHDVVRRPAPAFRNRALAKQAGLPVVIADVGTNGGDYASFIMSDNHRRAHDVGAALAAAPEAKGWENGSVGIVAVSQARTSLPIVKKTVFADEV